MRRLFIRAFLLAIACVAVVVALGCGGGSDGAASPLDNALGYLPKDAPLVAAIETDVEGEQYDSINKIVDKFPFGESIKNTVKGIVENEGGSYEDIKPLLGNEFVVGATNASALTGDSDSEDFIGAVQAKDKDKLEEAIKKDDAKQDGEKYGAKIYKDDDGSYFGVEDDVLVVAGSRRLLEAALQQREAENRLTEDVFHKTTADLPKDALVRVGGDLQKLLASDPSTAEARKIKWVNALRTFGLTLSFQGDEADVGFRVNTDPAGLTDADLPIKSGDASPSIVDRANEIVAGIKDPTQIVDFAEDAGQAIDPSGFGDYARAKATIEKQLDLDIERDFLGQLEGDLSIIFTVNGKFGARSQVKDPDAFDKTLAKLGKVVPQVARSALGEPVGYAKPKKGGDFYALSTASGDSIVYGVVDGAFVLANDARIAGRLSSEDTMALPGAVGSVVLKANAASLVRQLLGELGGAGLAGGLITGPLGDLTGSMKADTSGISGNLRLGFK